jgi:hypothetical protein
LLGGELLAGPAALFGRCSRDKEKGMGPRLTRLALTWILLLVLLAIELGISRWITNPELRPIILIPAVLMVACVGWFYMEAGRGPEIVRLFVAASLLWLAILLGLGSLDPLTRDMYYVSSQ